MKIGWPDCFGVVLRAEIVGKASGKSFSGGLGSGSGSEIVSPGFFMVVLGSEMVLPDCFGVGLGSKIVSLGCFGVV